MIAWRETREKLTKSRVFIFSFLRLHSLHLVTSPDYTYSKGYLGLYSELGALLSIITCSGLGVFTLVSKWMKRPRRTDQYQDESNLRQVRRTTASQMSMASQATLEPAVLVEERRSTPDQESIKDHTSPAVTSRMSTYNREAVCALTSPPSASTKDLESSPIRWDLVEINLALEKARLGEDLPQPWADWMGCRRAPFRDVLIFMRNKLIAE